MAEVQVKSPPEMTLEDARKWIGLGMAMLAPIGIIILFAIVWINRSNAALAAIVLKNFAVVIGLPVAATAAFIVVVFFRQTEQPMTLKIPGFEMKGSAGEIVLWIATFLAIAVAIKLLWVP